SRQGCSPRQLLLPRTPRRVRSHCRHVARPARRGAACGRVDRACAVDGSVRRPGGVMKGSPRRSLVEAEAGVLLALILISLLFAFLIGPQFFRAANLELMARQTAIVCVAALGMTMVIVSGGIDLSVGSVISLSTVVA